MAAQYFQLVLIYRSIKLPKKKLKIVPLMNPHASSRHLSQTIAILFAVLRDLHMTFLRTLQLLRCLTNTQSGLFPLVLRAA
jgi:hypothetical protein